MTAIERMREKMQLLGIEPKKSLGQNFLIADHVIDKIIKATQSVPSKKVIEIGPGLGALTDLLKEQYKNLTLLELDSQFAIYWRTKGMNLVEGDALRADWEELIESETILVSNLPYQISSSIVIDRSLDQKSLDLMVLMFQKEVAERIVAKPQNGDYGILTVIAQSFWKIEKVSDAGTVDFFPSPKVASRVLQFKSIQSSIMGEDKKRYLQFVKAAFSQRRKLMSKNLKSLGYLDDSDLKNVMSEMKLTDKVRSEELSVEQFMQLFNKCKVYFKTGSTKK